MFLLIDWLGENMETIQLSLSLMTKLAEKKGKNPWLTFAHVYQVS